MNASEDGDPPATVLTFNQSQSHDITESTFTPKAIHTSHFPTWDPPRDSSMSVVYRTKPGQSTFEY